MNGDVYEDKDTTKAYRIEDGAEVSVPKAWLESGSPYRSSYTTTSPEDAASDSGDEPRKASESWSREDLEAAAVASGMSPEDASAAAA